MTKTNNTTGPKSPGDLLALKGSDYARKQLASLSPQAQLHTILTASPHQRLKLISLLKNPKKIIRALPEEELYWTIKEVGTNKCLPLIKRSSPDQTQFIFDVEWWEADALSPKRITHWIKALVKCEDAKIIEWFEKFEFDFLVSALKRLISVHKPLDDNDDYGESIEGLPTYTLDGVYFIFFRMKEAEAAMDIMLRTLISYNNRLFCNIMEAIIWGEQTEMLFDAFEKTQWRLEEKGIPDYDDARSIYRYVAPEERDSLPKRADSGEQKSKTVHRSYYPIHIGGTGQLFLSQVLAAIEDYNELEELSLNLTAVANKVMVADHFSLKNHADYKINIAKSAGIINIGLEYQSGGDLNKAIRILQENWLENLFHIGWSIVLELKKKIAPVLDLYEDFSPLGIKILDSPLQESIEGLKQEKPLYFCDDTDEAQKYRDFHSLEEIRLIEERVQYALCIGKHIIDCLQLEFEQQQNMLWGENITLSTIFLTGFVHHTVNGSWMFKPIDLPDLHVFLNMMYELETNPDTRQTHIEEQCMDAVTSSLRENMSPADLNIFSSFVCTALKTLSNEYAEATADSYLDVISFKSLFINHFNY
ncbi:MAG: DUF6178 family protein [Candidatus Auribacterota bacterium]